MKKPLLLGIILTVCVVIVAFVFAQFYPEGMISYWKFDEGEGITAFDSADANDGTLITGPVWTAGKVGGALSFDGLDNYVEVPNSADLDITDAITIEAWVYMISAPTNMRVICKPYSISAWTSPYADYELVILNEATGWSGYPGRAVYFGLNLGGAWIYLGTTSLNTVPLDAWTHLAATYDGSSMKICINGIERAFRSVSGTIGTSDNPLFIGTRTPAPGEVFSGLIDEVAIYGRALSEAEIQQHYENGSYEVECVPPPSGMVSWWPGDTDANDIADGNDGTLNGAIYVPGKVDQAFSFDGEDDYVEIPSFTFNENDVYSVDFWFYPKATGLQYILDFRVANSAGQASTIAFDYHGNREIDYVVYGAGVPWPAPGTIALSLNEWHHVGIIHDSVNNRVISYVDGKKDIDETYSWDFTPVASPLKIGIRSGTYTVPTNGLIDEVEIFNRALSQSEIQAIYLAGSAGKCKELVNELPIAVCMDIEIPLVENCQSRIITAGDVDGGSTDPDEGDTISLSINNIGPLPLGDTLVTLTVTDEHGASDTCEATVTVVDTTLPVPDMISLETLTDECSVTIISAPTATDNCAESITGTTNDLRVSPLSYMITHGGN